MQEGLLSPAHSWQDAIGALEIPSLDLSYYPSNRSMTPDFVAEVEHDLAGVLWIHQPRPDDNPDVFRLGGDRFELRVVQKVSRGGAVVAVVLNVDPAESVPRKIDRLAPRRVTLREIRAENPCHLQALLADARRHSRRVNDDRRRGLDGTAAVRRHGNLHNDVRRQYGDLRALIDLMQQRPQPAEQTFRGEVQGDVPDRRRRGPTTFTVKVDGPVDDLSFKRVQIVRENGELYITRTVRCRADTVTVVEPQGWTTRKGEPVRLELVKPFGMRQNAQALQDFLAGKVEGSWEDLARLLCRQRGLSVPGVTSWPESFFCDLDDDVPVLDDTQRAAVAGAVASPHAFLIQGPPGTGKSEVICETVRQLVARGERVLLLAPTHVAVDEVLSRVGDKPGIRPLRITFDDDKVDPRLHGYLPANIGVEFTERMLRRPDRGRGRQWADELATVSERLEVMDLHRVAQHRLMQSSSRAGAARKGRAAGRRTDRAHGVRRPERGRRTRHRRGLAARTRVCAAGRGGRSERARGRTCDVDGPADRTARHGAGAAGGDHHRCRRRHRPGPGRGSPAEMGARPRRQAAHHAGRHRQGGLLPGTGPGCLLRRSGQGADGACRSRACRRRADRAGQAGRSPRLRHRRAAPYGSDHPAGRDAQAGGQHRCGRPGVDRWPGAVDEARCRGKNRSAAAGERPPPHSGGRL
ncbi:AAA domain-containing protein [Catellatospora coxensis]